MQNWQNRKNKFPVMIKNTSSGHIHMAFWQRALTHMSLTKAIIKTICQIMTTIAFGR